MSKFVELLISMMCHLQIIVVSQHNYFMPRHLKGKCLFSEFVCPVENKRLLNGYLL